MKSKLNQIEHSINMALSALAIDSNDIAKDVLLGALKTVYAAQKEAAEQNEQEKGFEQLANLGDPRFANHSKSNAHDSNRRRSRKS